MAVCNYPSGWGRVEWKRERETDKLGAELLTFRKNQFSVFPVPIVVKAFFFSYSLTASCKFYLFFFG